MQSLLIVAVLWTTAPQKTFDPHVYAYELFSEDEAALSRAQNKLNEEEALRHLRAAWVELDRIADAAAGLPEADARRIIRAQVRGDTGVTAAFAHAVSKSAAPTGIRLLRTKAGPWIWIAAAALALLILLRLRSSK